MSILVRLLACLVVLVSVGLVPPNANAQTAAQARPGPTGPHVGDAVILSSPVQDRRLQVTVIAFADPFDGRGTIRRGYRVVAAHLSLINRGSAPFELGNSQFVLLDDAGLYAFDVSWQYSEAALKNYPPLRTEQLAQGESADGWLLFQIPAEARPSAMAYVGYDLPPFFQVLAWLDPAPHEQDGAIPILEPSGTARGTFSIDHIITNFERTDPGIDPVRGSSTLALVVTIMNTSTETWELPDDAFWIVDQYGLAYHREVYNRQMNSYQTFPDLGFRARPNERVRGVLMFELPDTSELTNILYVPGDDQLYIIGGPDTDITIAAEDAEQVVSIEPHVALDPACAGIDEWAKASQVSMQQAAQVFESADRDGITAEGLRKTAASLSLIKRDQEMLAVPEEAEQAQTDVVNLLTVTINALENAADRIDAGVDAEKVMADLQAPQSPIMTAANKAARSVIAVLGGDCSGIA